MGRLKFSVRRLMILVGVAAIGFALINALPPFHGGRRSFCISNIRQLALAAIGFALGNNGEFPRGEVLAGMPPESGTSWICQSLVYLDNNDLYNAIDRSIPWNVPPNVQLATTNIRFTCPECRRVTAGGFATTCYVGIAGLGADAPTLAAGHPRAGMFGYTRVTRMSDIKDGAAQTMLLAETGLSGCWMSGGSSTIRAVDPTQRPYLGRGRPFGGLHEGCAVVAFADGSVRFIPETIHPKVFEAIATIAGGEPVPAELGER
jgi:hypothetical protein